MVLSPVVFEIAAGYISGIKAMLTVLSSGSLFAPKTSTGDQKQISSSQLAPKK